MLDLQTKDLLFTGVSVTPFYKDQNSIILSQFD